MVNVFTEPLISSFAIAWASAQVGKAVVKLAKKEPITAGILVADGGMPSSHMALASGLAAALLFTTGLSPYFAIALVVTLIIARDAVGVRKAVGEHAKILSKYGKKTKGEGEGHTIPEIIGGLIIGISSAAAVVYLKIDLFYLMQFTYLMLPGILANMAPVIAKRYIKSMGLPLDFKLKIGKYRILGDNKTIFGFLLGIAIAIIVADIQSKLYVLYFFKSLSILAYTHFPSILIGLVIGFGAMAGDSAKSFFKRRLGLGSGQTFFPFDQLDSAIGVLIIAAFFIPLSLAFIGIVLYLSLILHIAISSIGVFLGIKESI